MREKLVCYLLGELDEAERAELEARLANEPCLRKELEQIRAGLGLTGDADPASQHDCPDGLADRTADCISRLSALHDGVDAPCHKSRFTFVDVCVAAGVLLAVTAMLLPALPQSRATSRRLLCEDNMREIGKAMQLYAERNAFYLGDNADPAVMRVKLDRSVDSDRPTKKPRGHFPYIRRDENAGMFAVRLVESGVMSQSELQRLLWCRASGLQEKLRNSKTRLIIVAPTPEQLEQAKGEVLAQLRRWMAGSYAYRLGYVDDDVYYPILNYENSRSPILSDAPTYTPDGWVSLNHGAKGGQNVLYQDGSVDFQVHCDCPAMDSDLFVNHNGKAAAGQGESDVVLVRSDLTPGLGPQIKELTPAVFRAPRQE